MSHTIIHLVRHGEVYNPDRILYGRIPDYHLSARGQSMAAATAQSFTNHDIALLWSSPLERAQETAGPISETTGVDITLDDRLIEAGNRFEGLRVNSWRSQLINPIRWPLMWNPALPSWGEHYVDIAARMMDAVDKQPGTKEYSSHTNSPSCACNAPSSANPSPTTPATGYATWPASHH